jgi:hypothetical protein
VFPRTRSGLALLSLAAFAVSTHTLSGVSFAQGLVETATANATRGRFSSRDVPSQRGPFKFSAPYDTDAVRVTQSSDCGGADCVFPVGYSYWNNINNHVGSDTMLIVLNLQSNKGGAGPSLFSYNKKSGETKNHGSIFADDTTYGWATLSTGEGWYFSGTRPHALYINEPMGSRLFRYDVIAHTWETVFDASSKFGGKYIWQVHSSNDDRVHSATIRDKSSYVMEGCMVYRADRNSMEYFPAKGQDFDECQVDKSGRWLVIKEQLDGRNGEDNRVIDLDNGNSERQLMDPDGAAGHSDLGYGYLVAEDNFNAQPSAVRVWDFNLDLKGGEPTSPVPGQGTLVYQHAVWGPGLGHIAHSNSKPGVAPGQQMACASNASRSDLPRVNEIVCFRLNDSLNALVVAPNLVDLNASGNGGLDSQDYWKLPKGNLDVTGEYFIWTANVGSNRLDAFIVRIPQDRLGMSTSGSSTPASSSPSTPPSSSPSSSGSSESSGSASRPSSSPNGTFNQPGVILPGDQSRPNSIPSGNVHYTPAGSSAGSQPSPAPAPAPTPGPSAPAGNAVAVSWTSVVNASAIGSTLMKNAGCGGCGDAGAISSQKISNGDGYVEFSVPENATLRFIGLSAGNAGTDPGEIKFALRLQGGLAEVRESGAYKSEIAFSAGDVLRVAIAGGVVQYSKNGGVFYTSTGRPAYPAIVDTSLFDANATIWNAVIAGAK